MWPSSEPVNRNCESGEKHKDLIGIACPSKVRHNLFAATSNMFIVPSIAALAIYFPSGL